MSPYVTIWRADSPLARCVNCGSQQQYHGRHGSSCTGFRAETIDDIEPADLRMTDAYRALGKALERRDECWREAEERFNCGEDTALFDAASVKHDDRATQLRDHLISQLEAASGLTLEQLREVLS